MASINGIKVNNSALYDPKAMIQAGIDQKTGLPIKAVSCDLKSEIKKNLRIIDEQDALNRFKWNGLPHGLSGQLMERILYYRGQGMFFYIPTNDQYYFLPYTLEGNIDVYGRYTGVTPLPFNGSIDTEKNKKPWIQGLIREPLYDVLEEGKESDNGKYCVLIHDYSNQWAQTNIPRYQLQDAILDVMSDCIPFCRTALLNSTGIQGIRVPSSDDYSSVDVASKSINRAALEGRKYIPIIGNIDFQDLTDGNVAKTEEFMLAMQSLDNFRLSQYGLENGGLFEKKSHELQSEDDRNTSKCSRVFNDGLERRQSACEIINSIFNLNMSVEPTETKSTDEDNVDETNDLINQSEESEADNNE